MNIVGLRSAVVEAIKGRLPDLADCRSHPGRFNLVELENIAVETPAVLVACLGLEKALAEASGGQERFVKFAAFIVTTDEPDLARDVAAINIAEELLAWLPGRVFGLGDYVHSLATRDMGEVLNLYSSELNNRAVALWAVTWKQKIRIGCDVHNSNNIMPATLYISQSPKIGADHEGAYERIDGGEA